MRRLSKEMRWTLYTLIIIVVMGFGYWVTFTQRPDHYTPAEAPASSTYGDSEDSAAARPQESEQADE